MVAESIPRLARRELLAPSRSPNKGPGAELGARQVLANDIGGGEVKADGAAAVAFFVKAGG